MKNITVTVFSNSKQLDYQKTQRTGIALTTNNSRQVKTNNGLGVQCQFIGV